MNFKKVVLIVATVLITLSISAQKTEIYTNQLKDYNHAVELYQNKSYAAAQQKFEEIKHQYDYLSEIKANCEYYIANAAIRLGQQNADDLMQNFVNKYPTSTKRNGAFLDVAEYYFKTGNYPYATKWYAKVKSINLSIKQEEAFHFNYGYALFATKNFKDAQSYFLNLLDSQEYGARAKYYYGYIAYDSDDYTTADKYLNEVANDASYKTDVSYYLADMNFKLGKFDKAIENGLPLLTSAKGIEHSEISKIVGESYFNLQQYNQAITHLNNYKGKRGKFNNTDFYLLGYSYYKQKDYENAINNFNKIIDGTNSVAQNAYYHLAECYLNLNKKQEALNAFRNASQMDFSDEIKKDAWLNYAKLSYEIGNPYKSVPDVLIEYMNTYPNSSAKTEINNLIISAYITAKDYKGALEFLKNKKTSKEQALYQKVAFYRGIELFNEDNYNAAKENFENSLTVFNDATITAQATFWKGESNYRLQNYIEAIKDFKSFLANNNAIKTNEINEVNYNLGYAYFKQKEFENAIDQFKKYTEKSTTDAVKKNDSYLRIGDSYFITRDYNNTITFYNKAIEMKGVDTDYAQFQKAISYGLIGNEKAKIKELQSFLANYSKSGYRDDAYYVLGNSYINKNENTLALESFDKLISEFKRSPLLSKAMLKKGLIYYNTDRNELALTTYKNVVKQFPNSAEAKQAIKNSRQIYVDLGRVDEYAAWIKNIDYVTISDAELDNDMYESAEKQYLQNDHKKSIVNFKKYLQNFPNGLHKVQANFYLAQSLQATNEGSEAIKYYSFVIEQPQNEFSENALYKLSVIYLENNNWAAAIPILERLEKEAEQAQNISFAQANLMKGFYATENYTKAETYAQLILNNAKTENRIKSDAHIIIARAAIKAKNETKAREAYKKVEEIAGGELKAEALYYKAYFEHVDGSYRVSNDIIQNIASDYASYKYWGAKGLILMAKNFNKLNDAYQATYILESVQKNFSQFDDVVEEAAIELNKIKTEQAKTNESVKN